MQGRKNRDDSAAAEQEPRGGTGLTAGAPAPPHAQNPGRTASVDAPERDGRPGSSKGQAGPTKPAAPSVTTKGPTGPGSRIALRNWRISTRLVALLTLPVVAATSLGALRIVESLDNIEQLDNMKLLTEMTKQATDLATALQEERDASAGPLANGAKADSDFSIKAAREKTKIARDTFLQSTTDIESDGGSGSLNGVREHAVQIARDLIGLNEIRQNAYKDHANTSQTVEAYSRIINQLLSLSTDMAQATNSPQMIQRTRALAAFSSAKEYASEQRAIIAAALPPNAKTFGSLSETDRQYAQAAQENQASQLESFKSVYGSVSAEELLKPLEDNNATITASDSYAERVLRDKNGLRAQDKRSYRDWFDNDSQRIQQMSSIELTLLNEMEQQARELRNESEQSAIVNGALILLVLGVSLVGAFVVARSMIRSLRRLQDTATKVAQDRLPELVKELSESDPQDVDTSVESVGVHSRDEIGKVAAAFDDVHREAVRLAAEQALLRGNVNAMFTNLSRRSQGLIQRQLSLISELESREADPDQLSSLFKLDHLATRMRRNGENLLVLAGEEPGRRWTRPVPLVDVLRAAASEVEQYERIELAAVPATDVAGRVVNDLVHLLAELLENATSFSSPQTKVKVTGHALPDGRVLVEIHDTGIGLSPEDLASINERLAAPPTVDVSVSRRMGLFVVGRLSQRHGIRIQLRPSDSGGTTALVMLPIDVAQGGKKAPGKKGPGGSGGPAAAQAASGAAAARRGVQGAGAGAGAAGRLGAGPSASRPQVGAGGGAPRAALPSRDAGGRGQQNPQQSPQGPGNPQGLQNPQGPGNAPMPQRPQPARAQNPQGPQNPQAPAGTGGSLFDAGMPGPVPPQQRTHADPNGPAQSPSPSQSQQGGRPVLPPRGGPRAELPGGNPQPRKPSWSDENAQPHLDAPRGHDEPDATSQFPPVRDDRQGPGATAEFARPDFDAPRPVPQQPTPGQQDTGQFMRSDVYGGQDNGAGNSFGGNGFANNGAPQYGAPHNGTPANGTPANGTPAGGTPHNGYQNQRPQQDEYLPPASGPVDQRTPLFDNLETNWRQGQQAPQQPQQPQNLQQPQAPQAPQQPQAPQHQTPPQQQSPLPSRPQTPAGAPRPAGTADSGKDQANWRQSPNDELMRQAERVRKPAAGGVTVSGLPRRVPRANLVAGTAQEQQQNQTGPQVSRSPDDVRGRLTNLRRGIQQGRQAGSTGQTGSYPRPTHQQER